MYQRITDKLHPGSTEHELTVIYARKVDVTCLWKAYQPIGMFARAYLYPEFGFLVDIGEFATVITPSPISEFDLFCNMCKPSGCINELARELSDKMFGPYPGDGNEEQWMINVIDKLSVKTLEYGVLYAFQVSMLDFFDTVATLHAQRYPDEHPTLREQFNGLVKLDYAKLFEVELIKTFMQIV